MADEDEVSVETFSQQIITALIDILKTANTPEQAQAQAMLMRRLALTGDVIPSRIPAPRNISEIGGYLNLLESLQETELRAQTLASVLGVAGPNPQLGWFSPGPVLFYASRPNDRPACPQQATIPVQFTIRSDFAVAFDAALKDIHDAGCALPVLSPVRSLPPAAGAVAPPTDLLRYIGRTLDLVPSAALLDPTLDPLAIGNPGVGGNMLVALQLNPTAPNAATVLPAPWQMQKCGPVACTTVTVPGGKYLALAGILNVTGWYHPLLTNPTSLSQPGEWARWTNITGLVAGVTLYGDELQLLHTMPEIVASSLRERLLWVWDGTDFIAP
jgi:hypothetical protein